MSRDKVSALTCVNERGNVFLQEACLGKMGTADATRALSSCALAGAVVSTDRLAGYVGALREYGVAIHGRFDSRGHAALNRVNALHSALRLFIGRFRGVSTRRLHGYLMWFKWLREARRTDLAASLLLEQARSGRHGTTRAALRATPYPFHPELDASLIVA